MLPTDAGTVPAKAKPGPVDYERFTEVNERMKAAEKRSKDIEGQLEALAWAKELSRDSVADLARWKQHALVDPAGFFTELMRTAPPHIQQLMRSEFARQLATRNDPEPPPDLMTEGGQRVYSADQLRKWHDWRARAQQGEFAKQLEPLRRELSESRQQRMQATAEAQSKAFAGTAVERAQKWPHFQDHIDAIAEEYAKQPIGRGTPEEEMLALHEAYVTVLETKVFPTISETAQQKAIADFQTKAAASTEQPGRATTSTPTRPKSLGEALRAEAAKVGWR